MWHFSCKHFTVRILVLYSRIHSHSDRKHHRRVSIAQAKMKLKEENTQKAKDRKNEEIIQEILKDEPQKNDNNDTVNESNEEVTDIPNKKMHSKRDTRELNSE